LRAGYLYVSPHGEVFARHVRIGSRRGWHWRAFPAPPFAGASSAWFQREEIERFAATLVSAYPLDSSSPVTLVGGIWGKPNSGIEQPLISLSFYPVGSLGRVGCRVLLATPSSEQWPESRSRVEVELLTSYEGVRDFSRGLRGILKSEVKEALLAEREA
jgi:hypothetical protein